MKHNKRLLKKKFGGLFELRHIRDCNLDVVRAYLALLEENLNDETRCQGLCFRLERRLEFARTLFPTSPLKKMRYGIGLGRVVRRYKQIRP